MLYEANIYQMKVEDHTFWVAESKSLKGCVGQGETSDEAINELEVNEKEWLLTAQEFGIPIPPHTIKTERTYSGKLSLRISPYVHEHAAMAAQEQGISLNQFMNDAIIQYTNDVLHSMRNEVDQEINSNLSSQIIQFPGPTVSPYHDVEEEVEEM